MRTDPQTWGLYHQLEIPFVSVIREMQNTGIWFDLDKIKSIGTALAEEAKEVAAEMKRMAGHQNGAVKYLLNPMDSSKLGDKPGQFIFLGHEVDPKDLRKRLKFKYQAVVEFNPNSNVHKQAAMKAFGLDVPSCTKSDLEKYGEGHPFVELCLRYSPLIKAQTTYIEPIIQSGGFMLPSWHQTGTKTGRLSSSNPNAQNFPKRTKLGASIRECIIPPANQTFVGCDLGQIEYRILSWYLMEYFPDAEDAQRLWDTFRSGRDIHSEVSEMLGLEKKFNASPKEARFMAKVFSYGSLYGFGPHTCSALLKMPFSEAQQLLELGKERTPSIYKLKKSFWAEFRACDGLGYTLFGRRLYYPDMTLPDLAWSKVSRVVDYKGNPIFRREAIRRKAAAERESFNAKIQGTQADIIKLMTLQVMEPMHELGACLVLMAHDEVLFQVFDFNTERARMVLEKGFSRSVDNDILPGMPIVTDVGTGKNWLEVH
jgi:DNA polymerase-1